MVTQRSDGTIPTSSVDVSRRLVLRLGAGGLAAALMAQGLKTVVAQEATPPSEGGMPPGVGIIPGVTVPVNDMPVGGVDVAVYRVTLEAGASSPEGTYPYPSIGIVEQGTLICPGGAPRFVVTADGTVREEGAGDITVNKGEAIYVPTNVSDGARNDGTEQLVILLIEFLPASGMATPTT